MIKQNFIDYFFGIPSFSPLSLQNMYNLEIIFAHKIENLTLFNLIVLKFYI